MPSLQGGALVMNNKTLPDIVFDTIHYVVTLCSALAIIAFVAFYMSHHQGQVERRAQPGELVRTPDDGVISYKSPASGAPSGGPWCYVVQNVSVQGQGPGGGATGFVYARTCEELPLRWIEEKK